MSERRIKRINSLLKEVISKVIKKEVRNPYVSKLTSVTEVTISKDLHQAKVFISVIGDERERAITLNALQSAAGYISRLASKKVVMRYFPTLTFKLDTTVDKQMHINSLLEKIHADKRAQNYDKSS